MERRVVFHSGEVYELILRPPAASGTELRVGVQSRYLACELTRRGSLTENVDIARIFAFTARIWSRDLKIWNG